MLIQWDEKKLNILREIAKGRNIDDILSGKVDKFADIDQTAIGDFIKEERLIDVLSNNLSNYVSPKEIIAFIELVKIDLERTDRSEKGLVLNYNRLSEMTNISVITLKRGLKTFEEYGYLKKSKSQIAINYKYLLDNIFISNQPYVKIYFGKKPCKNKIKAKLKEENYNNINELLSQIISEVTDKFKETIKISDYGFDEEKKNAVLNRLYSWTLQLKAKKLDSKKVNYTIVDDRYYFYYNLKEALSNRDKQILDYLANTGEIYTLILGDKNIRYALKDSPNLSDFEPIFDETVEKKNETKEEKKDKITQQVESILEERGLLDTISDKYYESLMRYANYLKDKKSSLGYTLPSNIDLLERLDTNDYHKIQIIENTIRKGYNTVEYVIKQTYEDEIPLKKSTPINEVKNNLDKSEKEKLRDERRELFKRECAAQLKELESTDPDYSKRNQLLKEYFKQKGWEG